MSYPCTYCLESTAGIVEATLCNSLRHLAAQSAEAGLETDPSLVNCS